MMKKTIGCLLAVCILSSTYAQERVNDFNNTNWLQTINTISLGGKWSAHIEYQWRRVDGFKHWQQSLLRGGVNYKLNDIVTLHAGYAFADTYSYGDFPLAANGTFPEHRIYEQVVLRQPINKLLITHRFRVEQRWIGRVRPGTAADREIETWLFSHRFRYQARAQYPLWQKNTKQLYAVAADELFVSAGKNVGVNTFDQNRIYGMLGFKFNKTFSLEAGYFNQTLQQGRRVNDKIIMQRNNGFIFSSYLNL